MKTLGMLCSLMLLLTLVGTAPLSAQELEGQDVNVSYNGLVTYGTINVYVDEEKIGRTHAVEFKMWVDGSELYAFTTDVTNLIPHEEIPGFLRMPFSFGQDYLAASTPLPAVSPWCEMAYILTTYEAEDSFWGAVLQTAVWKLAHGERDELIRTTDGNLELDLAVELQALELIEEADGRCVVSCDTDANLEVTTEAGDAGMVTGLVALTAAGGPVAGQAITVETSVGTIVEPLEGEGVTDENGQLAVTIAPEDPSATVTLTATAAGHDIAHVVPVDEDFQSAVTFFAGEACELTAVSDYVPTPAGVLGDPRRMPFWKFQLKVALRCDAPAPGKKKLPKFCQKEVEFTKDALETFVPISFFGGEVADLDEAFRVLTTKAGAKQMVRAQKQCLANMLNVAAGELAMDSPIDLDGDGVTDGVYADYYADAEAAYEAGQYRKAKKICRKINLL